MTDPCHEDRCWTPLPLYLLRYLLRFHQTDNTLSPLNLLCRRYSKSELFVRGRSDGTTRCAFQPSLPRGQQDAREQQYIRTITERIDRTRLEDWSARKSRRCGPAVPCSSAFRPPRMQAVWTSLEWLIPLPSPHLASARVQTVSHCARFLNWFCHTGAVVAPCDCLPR